MSPDRDLPDRDLPIDLLVTSARFVRFVRRHANIDTSVAEWRALVLLDEHGPVRVGDFAALDRLSQPTATAMLNRLVDQGAARRTPDPTDRRANRVELTTEGRDRLAVLRSDAGRSIAPLLANLTAIQLDDLRRATRLLANLVSETDPGHDQDQDDQDQLRKKDIS
ncbi:MAG: MarR family transcriptional regulator [Propionibacteriales bacterium]|nr:MarR family transcriptional regulator [Propionibacteriales bacterium]